MSGSHNPWLVLLSVIVATMASFVALELAARVVLPGGRKGRPYWLAGGALSIGIGIWSMHFIGMLGFRLPTQVSYDISFTLLSLIMAVAASACGFVLVSRDSLGTGRLVGGGLAIGIAIASMHYTGMAAMKMDPPIRYASFLFGLSIAIALGAAVISLWSAFQLRSETLFSGFWKKAGSALVMGFAIYGMHYTGMAAAVFAPGSVSTVHPPQDFNPVALAVSLGALTLLFLMGTLLISAYEAFRAERLEKHGEHLSRRLVGMQDEERRRLAAELHDIVGQTLSALNAELALVCKELPPGTPASLSRKLADAARLVRLSVEAVRNVMAQLRPPGLDELGLAAALRWHAEGFKARTGMTVNVAADESLPRPSPEVEDALLRIYLEALTNVARHAQAREVRVTLGARNGAVALTIADDGRGFDAAAPLRRDEKSGWGLLIMKERAAAIGGKLEVRSAPGAGTRVEFALSKERWS